MRAEIKKKNTLKINLRKVKHSGRGLTKYLQDLYTENYKILMTEIKEESNKCRDSPHL